MADEASAGWEGRPFWSGTITFGLVSIPVELYSIVRPRRAALRMLSSSGHPLVRRYHCSQDGMALDSDQLVRGYDLGEGHFVVVTDEELQAAEPKKSRDIELSRFVKREDIDPMYFERPYLMAPAGRSTKAYHLLANTLEEQRRCGIATFVMRGREHLTAIFAKTGLLWAMLLRFPVELRSPEDVGLTPPQPAPRATVRAFKAALKALHDEHVELPRDEAAQRVLELAERKRAEHRDVIEVPEVMPETAGEAAGNVVDIVQLLKERLGQVEASAPAADLAASRQEPPDEGAEASTSKLDGDVNKKQLYERAKSLGIEGRSKMSKQALLRAVREAS